MRWGGTWVGRSDHWGGLCHPWPLPTHAPDSSIIKLGKSARWCSWFDCTVDFKHANNVLDELTMSTGTVANQKINVMTVWFKTLSHTNPYERAVKYILHHIIGSLKNISNVLSSPVTFGGVDRLNIASESVTTTFNCSDHFVH